MVVTVSVVLLLVLTAVWFLVNTRAVRGDASTETTQFHQSFSDRERRTITINDSTLEVEVVTTPESTTQGLSGREEIGADGMLFVFPTTGVRQFWMPEMKFDIDIVWIRNAEVVGVAAQVPKPAPAQTALPTYSSELPVNVVLELPSGKANDLGIKPGSTVIY